MTEPPEPRRPEESGGEEPQPRGNPPGSKRAERERSARKQRNLDNFRRTTGKDPNHPVAGSQKWAEQKGFVVSAQEISQRLVQLSQSTDAMGAVQQAKQSIESLGNEAVSAMGDSHPAVGDVMGPISQASQLCDQLMEAIAAACGAIAGVGHTIGGTGG